ncbi:MAG: DUF481 domain-containing protein [Sulfurimonas sp.]|nr:DUF481 domain-containing protein [Sulfurimonas sp.]
MKKILVSALITSSLVVSINAQDKLTTHAELGYIDTQGNTKTQTFNLDSEIKKNFDKHMFTLTLDAQYATTDKTETKNKYLVEASYDYAYTDRVSFGYLLGFKQDGFSGFDYQLYTGPTLKYQAIKTKAHNLALGLSILYAQDKVENTNDADGYVAYGASLVYAWQINEDLKFGQDLGYRSEFEDAKNYFVSSKTSLVSKISDIFSAGVSYKVDYANILPMDKVHTDRTFTVNLIMDY